jgi:nucleotide-binding universal stress UspA family protein
MDLTETIPGILVPLDGSPLAEQALPYAQALLAPGAAMTLLGVVEETEPIPTLWEPPLVPLEDVRGMLEQQVYDDLARAEATLQGERSSVRLLVARGDPADQIVRVATERQVELIAMSTHGRGALGRWIFGSVADRVARSATVPVLLVRPNPGKPRPAAIRRVVVPLDGSALAEEALPTAQALAIRLNIPLHLITAIDIMRLIPPAFGPVVAFDPEVYQETLSQLESGAAATLAEASERMQDAGLHISSQVVQSSPFAAIADAVQDGDLIVMTSHGRGGVRRWVLGSVAEKLVREAPAPVILVPVAAQRSSLLEEGTGA